MLRTGSRIFTKRRFSHILWCLLRSRPPYTYAISQIRIAEWLIRARRPVLYFLPTTTYPSLLNFGFFNPFFLLSLVGSAGVFSLPEVMCEKFARQGIIIGSQEHITRRGGKLRALRFKAALVVDALPPPNE